MIFEFVYCIVYWIFNFIFNSSVKIFTEELELCFPKTVFDFSQSLEATSSISDLFYCTLFISSRVIFERVSTLSEKKDDL